MGGKSQTVTQNASPWSAAQPYLLGALGQAQNLYQGGGFAPVPYGFGQFAQPQPAAGSYTSTAGASPQLNPPSAPAPMASVGNPAWPSWLTGGAGGGNSGDFSGGGGTPSPTPVPATGSGGTQSTGAYNPFAGMTPAQMEQAAQQAAQMMVPGFSNTTQNAMADIIRQAGQGGQGIQDAQSYLTGMMSPGSGLSPGAAAALSGQNRMGPQNVQSFLSSMMGGGGSYPGMDAVRQNILGSAIPQAASMFSGSGLTNSSMAQEGVGRAATEALAPFEYGAFENAQNRAMQAAGMRQGAFENMQGRRLQSAGLRQGAFESGQNRGLQAAGMMPGMEQAAYLPAQMRLGMGQLQDQMRQNRATAAQQAYGQAAGLPAANFSPYLNAIMGLGGMGGSQASTGPQPGTGIGPAIMGGLGTYGALAGIPGLSGGMAGMGGLLAALAGMSDRRAKEDIQRIGITDGGSPVYKYRYKGTQDWHIGVMADENPHAIKGYVNGYALVDYGRIH